MKKQIAAATQRHMTALTVNGHERAPVGGRVLNWESLPGEYTGGGGAGGGVWGVG
jgi:hypothetical protein